MAKVFPGGWRELIATGAAERELQTLAVLADGLNDDYAVYHGVHWTRVDKYNFAVFGEIDFVIVGPMGKVLLIEQKNGFLSETTVGLTKSYPNKEKNVAVQMARSADALHSRLRQACQGQATSLDSLLYCPDYRVKQLGTAGIDPARIVDAAKKDSLLSIIETILPASGEALPAKEKIHNFFGDILQLVPDANAMVGGAQKIYTRLSGGLALWARKIECEPFRLRVIGTAGSGKTQLAVSIYRDAVSAGRRPLYVCYNRPLADHIARIVPDGGEVVTYHQLADRIYRAGGNTPDFIQPGVFSRFEAALDTYMPDDSRRFDELIVDEGQDFQESWAANLMRFLSPNGRAWWLEDPMQNLYSRPSVSLPGWVSLRSNTNYRSPKDIVETLNRILPLTPPLEAGSPICGSEVDIVTYSDTAELIAKTIASINDSIHAGFKPQHIAVISYRGREHSRLAPYDKLGSFTLRAPTGKYDPHGNPIYTDGDVLIDSVLRFKGRAAPCVILTEIDFETLDDSAVRRIFVGATRATMKLTLVVSEASANVLLARLANS